MPEKPVELEKNSCSKTTLLKINVQEKTGELTVKEESTFPPNPDREAAEAEVVRLIGQAKANGWTKLFDTLCYLLKKYGPYAAAFGAVYLIQRDENK